MLWGNTKAEIKVTEVDNGYVVEWSRRLTPKERKTAESLGREDESAFGEHRGMEIVTTKAALLKRLKELA